MDKRRSRSRIGSILLPAATVDKPLADDEMVQLVNEYLPIVLYLSKKFGYTNEAKTIDAVD